MPDNGAVLVVADTLRKHGFGHTEESRVSSRTVDHCCCGWRSTFEHRTHADHVAAAVVDALGGLGRAWAAVLPDDSYFTPYHEGHEFHPGEAREQAVADVAEYEDSRLSSRWVSGWVREESE